MAASSTAPALLGPPSFSSQVFQCEPVTISWSGGLNPVRVEAFFQNSPTGTWRFAGPLPAEAASGNSIRWVANIPSGAIAWITLIDHTGRYRQSSNGTTVLASSNSTCLESMQTASVITQTVYMASNLSPPDASRTLNDRSLLVVSIVFGILLFAALTGLVWLASRMRQLKRAREGTGRFSMVDDSSSFYREGDDTLSPSSLQGRGSGLGSTTSAAVARGGSVFGAAMAATAAAGYRHARRQSGMSDTPSIDSNPRTPYPGDDSDEKRNNRSPDRANFSDNPFVDPPSRIATGGRRISNQPTLTLSPVRASAAHLARSTSSASIGMSERPASQRPGLVATVSASDSRSMSSATSMQLFGTEGGLRITNDPRLIPTPQLSRVQTQTSSDTHYPAETMSPSAYTPTSRGHGTAFTSNNDDDDVESLPSAYPATSPSGSGTGTNTQHRQRRDSDEAYLLSSSQSVRSYDSYASQLTGTDATISTTADHYTEEPHSSKPYNR